MVIAGKTGVCRVFYHQRELVLDLGGFMSLWEI